MRCDHRCKERAVFARRRGALRRFMLAAAVCAAVPFGMTDSMAGDQPLQLFAAGSLKAALSDVAAEYEAMYDMPVANTLGASGLLRERIEKGETEQVFASANMRHPQTPMEARK